MTDVKGVDSLIRKLSTIVDNIEPYMINAIRQGSEHVRAAAQLLCTTSHGGLKSSIFVKVDKISGNIVGFVYTDNDYAQYVEFGAGPKGEANHGGISPIIDPAYTQSPWWIHESQTNKMDAEKYHWFALETKDGTFYQVSGQAAHPFMYPALKNNEKEVVNKIAEYLGKKIKEIS